MSQMMSGDHTCSHTATNSQNPTLARRAHHDAFSHSNNKMRVVLSALATYSRIGGLQQFNRRLVMNLAARTREKGAKASIGLFCEDPQTVLPEIEGMIMNAPRNNWLFSLKTLWFTISRADVMAIAHINLLPLAALARCLRPRLPIILFVHGIEVWNMPIYRSKRWYEPLLMKTLTSVVSVSAFTANTMAREYHIPKSKFRLLPNAVDAISISSTLRRNDSLSPPIILSVARLGCADREKNFDKAIRAIAKLRPLIPEIRYEIIGDGDLRPELEALARDLGIAQHITFLGRVSEAELAAAYNRASVFIMPSSKEGFGIVYLEAWQRGLPVICGNEGAPKEIIENGIDGFVVDPNNIEMIADRLHHLLTHPDLAHSMGEKGRIKVEAHYSNAAFRMRLDQLLDEIANDHNLRKL